MQNSTLAKHNRCEEHRAAVEADQMRRQLYEAELNMSGHHKNEATKKAASLTDEEQCLFSSVYFAAHNTLPNELVNSLIELNVLNGAKCSMQNLSWDSVRDVQCSLCHVLDCDLRTKLNQSKFVGDLVDESTDIAVSKNLIMYVRYVSMGDVCTEFVTVVQMSDGKAMTITSAVENECKTLGLDLNKVVGLGSDGAAVMTGTIGGVGVLLRKSCPSLVHVHCAAHRLALDCIDASKDIPYMLKYKGYLGSLYSYFSSSAVRTAQLSELQEVLSEPGIKLKQPLDVRWLSMYQAVRAVHSTYGAVVSVLNYWC